MHNAGQSQASLSSDRRMDRGRAAEMRRTQTPRTVVAAGVRSSRARTVDAGGILNLADMDAEQTKVVP